MWWEWLSSPFWAWPCCCMAACWQKLSFLRLGRLESLMELPPWRACYWISGDTWFGWASKRIDRAKCIFCGMGCPAGFTRCGHLCNLKNISHNSGTIYQRELKVRMQRAKPTKTSSNIWKFQKLFNQYLKGHKYIIHNMCQFDVIFGTLKLVDPKGLNSTAWASRKIKTGCWAYCGTHWTRSKAKMVTIPGVVAPDSFF